MTYVITEPCIGVKDASCVDVCPVDCIHATDDDAMFFIDPDECIDCGACEPECPVTAIFAEDAVPDDQIQYIQINADYFKSARRPIRMVRLIALFRQPPDPGAFDAHYTDVHTPIVRRYPGLSDLKVTRLAGLGGQDPVFYQMAEMSFASRDDLDAALASDAGRESGRDLRNFAQAGVELFVADD